MCCDSRSNVLPSRPWSNGVAPSHCTMEHKIDVWAARSDGYWGRSPYQVERVSLSQVGHAQCPDVDSPTKTKGTLAYEWPNARTLILHKRALQSIRLPEISSSLGESCIVHMRIHLIIVRRSRSGLDTSKTSMTFHSSWSSSIKGAKCTSMFFTLCLLGTRR